MAEQHDERDIYDLGLQADLNMMTRPDLERRRILRMGAIGIGMLLAGCGPASATRPPAATEVAAIPTATSAPTPTSVPTATSAATASAEVCVDEIPTETAGPYPADGSNASSQTLNVLTRSGIVRSDIRTSTTSGTTAAGIPLQVVLTIVNAAGDCAPLAGHAVYLWHCNREGSYSLYSSGVTGEDYLRGVQETDGAGQVTFTSIYPGCYAGRWPHIHFEIYPSLASATSSSSAIHTSQLAFPEDVCAAVYATAGYEQSVTNLSRITLESDNIFGDGYSLQMATLSGDVASGYTARLTVGVAA
ncbi:intradiol ring-cleavage dioxygenase [Chloroflexia bacterium SDU3-3]|nr:intradiol ring-cleavage dioxygenase [Chloroflexia bacterium SDU3-3]